MTEAVRALDLNAEVSRAWRSPASEELPRVAMGPAGIILVDNELKVVFTALDKDSVASNIINIESAAHELHYPVACPPSSPQIPILEHIKSEFQLFAGNFP